MNEKRERKNVEKEERNGEDLNEKFGNEFVRRR